MTPWAYWWSLPGPSSFVRSLVGGLREGISLVVWLPRWAPPGLDAAVARGLDEGLRWRKLDLAHLDEAQICNPCRLLGLRYTNVPAHALYAGNEQVLIQSAEFAGMVVWVEGVSKQAWPHWRSFLDAYAEASRQRSLLERSMLCVVMRGCTPDPGLRTEVTLGSRVWRGYLSQVDMLAWAHFHVSAVQEASEHPLFARLRLWLVAELAGFDPLLVEYAATREIGALVHPAPWLRAFAHRRGWSVQSDPDWADGGWDEMDGSRRRHTAWLALHDDHEVQRLVWRAQLAVLFPFLEEERVRYAKSHAAALQRTSGRDTREIEIRDLCRALEGRLPAEEAEYLGLLRQVRNGLAHLQHVPADRLQRLRDLATGQDRA